jgi:hypothetical protein
VRATRVIGSAFATFIGFVLLLGGVATVVVHATQRDDAGFYTSSSQRFSTNTPVLMTTVDARAPRWLTDHPIGTVRLDVRPVGQAPVFIGIGPKDAVQAWLDGTSYERIDRVDLRPSRTEYTTVLGGAAVGPPGDQTFWVATAVGSGEQVLTWPSRSGAWSVVLMNATAGAGVTADVTAGINSGALLPIGLVMAVVGLLVLVAGLRLLIPVAGSTTTIVAQQGTGYPVRLGGRLDPGLSRWLWLVKWVLVIPHLIVLALLWLAVVPLTFIAGVAILFTGRYPRPLFEFNVGVFRWTWRVAFYSFSGLATDDYPPFSLAPDPAYPAGLEVDYPERLSRGLVLVKWWLLAIPHYLIIGLFAGGWLAWSTNDWRLQVGNGLIGILVFVAAVILAVTGTYPRALFDVAMGMNRWCFRVLAYAALMRDEYPPFRLDPGGADPGSVPAVPLAPPPLPERDRELISS